MSKELYSELVRRNAQNKKDARGVKRCRILCKQGDLFRIEDCGIDRVVSLDELIRMVYKGRQFKNICFLEPCLRVGRGC